MCVKRRRISREANPSGVSEIGEYREATVERIEDVSLLPRKTSKVRYMRPVPETDTGGRGENPKALE